MAEQEELPVHIPAGGWDGGHPSCWLSHENAARTPGTQAKPRPGQQGRGSPQRVGVGRGDTASLCPVAGAAV